MDGLGKVRLDWSGLGSVNLGLGWAWLGSCQIMGREWVRVALVSVRFD